MIKKIFVLISLAITLLGHAKIEAKKTNRPEQQSRIAEILDIHRAEREQRRANRRRASEMVRREIRRIQTVPRPDFTQAAPAVDENQNPAPNAPRPLRLAPPRNQNDDQQEEFEENLPPRRRQLQFDN